MNRTIQNTGGSNARGSHQRTFFNFELVRPKECACFVVVSNLMKFHFIDDLRSSTLTANTAPHDAYLAAVKRQFRNIVGKTDEIFFLRQSHKSPSVNWIFIITRSHLHCNKNCG